MIFHEYVLHPNLILSGQLEIDIPTKQVGCVSAYVNYLVEDHQPTWTVVPLTLYNNPFVKFLIDDFKAHRQVHIDRICSTTNPKGDPC